MDILTADAIDILPPEDEQYRGTHNDTDEQLFINEAAAFNCELVSCKPAAGFAATMGQYEVVFKGPEDKLRDLLNKCGWGDDWATWARSGDRLVCTLL